MTIGVCIMRKENEKAMVIAYSWYIHKLDRYTYSNNYYLLSVCPTNIEMSVSQWYRWHTNDTPHSSPSPLSDMEETHGRHVFNLYQKLRENRLPVELKLWSGQHGAEHFVLSYLHTSYQKDFYSHRYQRIEDLVPLYEPKVPLSEHISIEICCIRNLTNLDGLHEILGLESSLSKRNQTLNMTIKHNQTLNLKLNAINT